MEFRNREELVGKRFLSVASSQSKSKSKINEWDWEHGFVRASSSRDRESQDLVVLLEYDGVEQTQWIRLHDSFDLFLVERTISLVKRSNPRGRGDVWWPALCYSCIVDKIGLPSLRTLPVEYLLDRTLDFISPSKVADFPKKDSPLLDALKIYPDLHQAVKEWSDYQDGQYILLTKPTLLAGCRVSVYRPETGQWYTGVVKSFNTTNKTLSVISDTVLQSHSVDPSTLQIQLIDDGVIESILRGGVTPRRRSRNCKEKEVNYTHNSSITPARTTNSPLTQTSPNLPAKLARISRQRDHSAGSLTSEPDIKDKQATSTRRSHKRQNSTDSRETRADSSVTSNVSTESRIPSVDRPCRNTRRLSRDLSVTTDSSDSVPSVTLRRLSRERSVSSTNDSVKSFQLKSRETSVSSTCDSVASVPSLRRRSRDRSVSIDRRDSVTTLRGRTIDRSVDHSPSNTSNHSADSSVFVSNSAKRSSSRNKPHKTSSEPDVCKTPESVPNLIDNSPESVCCTRSVNSPRSVNSVNTSGPSQFCTVDAKSVISCDSTAIDTKSVIKPRDSLISCNSKSVILRSDTTCKTVDCITSSVNSTGLNLYATSTTSCGNTSVNNTVTLSQDCTKIINQSDNTSSSVLTSGVNTTSGVDSTGLHLPHVTSVNVSGISDNVSDNHPDDQSGSAATDVTHADDDSMHYKKHHLLSMEPNTAPGVVSPHGALSAASIDVTRSVTDQIAELNHARLQHEHNHVSEGGYATSRSLNHHFNEVSNLDGKRSHDTHTKHSSKYIDSRDYYTTTKESQLSHHTNGRSNVSPSNSRSSGSHSDTERRVSPTISPLVYKQHEVLNPYRDPELMRKNAVFPSAFTPHKTGTPPSTQSPYPGVHSPHASPLLQSRQQLLMQPYPHPALSLSHAQLEYAAAAQQQHLAQQLAAQYQSSTLLQMSPYANSSQLELLWRQKYPSVPVPSPWMLAKHNEDLHAGTRLREKELEERERRLERERKDREAAEHDRAAAEHDRLEREKAEKERADRERQEREKLEKVRLEREREQRHSQQQMTQERRLDALAAVNHHFDRSLQMAGCKEKDLLQYMHSLGYPTAYPEMRNALTERDIMIHRQVEAEKQFQAEKQAQAMKHEEILKQQQKLHKTQQKTTERYMTDHREQPSPSSRVAVTSTDPHIQYNPYNYAVSAAAGYPKSATCMTTMTVTTSSPSVSTSAMRPSSKHPAVTEPNFSLYGYQPFQHSYIPSNKLQMHKDDKSPDNIHAPTTHHTSKPHRSSPGSAAADLKYGSVIVDNRLKDAHLPVPHTSPGTGRSTEAWSSPSSGRSSVDASAFPSSSPPTSRQHHPMISQHGQQHAAAAAAYHNSSAFKNMDGTKSGGIKSQSPLQVASPQQLSAAVMRPIEKEQSSSVSPHARKSSPHYQHPHSVSPYQMTSSGQQVPVSVVNSPYLTQQGLTPSPAHSTNATTSSIPHQYPPHLVPQVAPRPSTDDESTAPRKHHKSHKDRDKDSPRKKKSKSHQNLSQQPGAGIPPVTSTSGIPHYPSAVTTTTTSQFTPTTTMMNPAIRGGFTSPYGSFKPNTDLPPHLNSFKSIVDSTVQAAFSQEQNQTTQPSPKPPRTTNTPPVSTNFSPPKTHPKTDRPVTSTALTNQQITRSDTKTTNTTTTITTTSGLSTTTNTNLIRASSASIMETINRVANGIIDTDSDTLSAPSPPPKIDTSLICSTGIVCPPKNFKKAWLQRHSDEDRERKEASNTPSPHLEQSDIKTDVKDVKDVKHCYVNCSYISPSKDTATKPPVELLPNLPSTLPPIDGITPPPVTTQTEDCEPPVIKKEPPSLPDQTSEPPRIPTPTPPTTTDSDQGEKKRKRKRKQKSSKKQKTDTDTETEVKEEAVVDTEMAEVKSEIVQEISVDSPPTLPPSKPSKEFIASVHDRLKAIQSAASNDGDSDASTGASEKANDDAPPNQGKKEKKRSRKSKNNKKDDKSDAPGSNFNKPLNRQTLAELKKSCEPFLQDGSCCEVTPRLMKCRECKMTPTQRSKKLPNIFCRFYAFRKLQYSEKGFLTIHGFSKVEDAERDDVEPWLPRLPLHPPKLDVETAKYIVRYIGELMCSMVRQEMAARNASTDIGKITWKRAVTGVREMCDVCDTTLFNIHWVCYRCGFVVCIDCYNVRVQREKDEQEDDVEDLEWLKCSSNRQVHEPDKLMLTQIIPSDALRQIDEQVHTMRDIWGIKYSCSCGRSRRSDGKQHINGLVTQSHKPEKHRLVNGVMDEHPPSKRSKRGSPSIQPMINGDCASPDQPESYEAASPLNILADVASSKSQETDNKPETEQDKNNPCTTLRDFLTKSHRGANREHGKRRNRSKNPTNNNNNSLDEIIKSVVLKNMPTSLKDTSLTSNDSSEILTNYMPRLKGSLTKSRVFIPRQSLMETSVKYPDVPHSWLCNGRLLRLHDSSHPGNMKIFQEQWRRGQPVLVSGLHNNLKKDIWKPSAFSKQFGHIENDLVDTRTGIVHMGHEMKHFWDGFDFLSKRLKGDNGEPMLLKLKDWPSGEDFRDSMPNRFQDIMNALPLPEYTRRDGYYNLAGRLPDFLVKPDLGPKMYNAYGSASFPKEGTTNLHLDISDAVNMMVYVGVPHDGPGGRAVHQAAALKAIDDAGIDDVSKKRINACHEIPGALWHMYNAQDANKIRDFLNKVTKEQGEDVELHHDPIHDQSWYLDENLRKRLKDEYGVEGYAILQCLGDCLFIPSGAAHQVRNLHSCIKVAEDFVTPENLSHCFQMTQEFRFLSESHTNHEDKLQVKNIVFHTVKDAVAVLSETVDDST